MHDRIELSNAADGQQKFSLARMQATASIGAQNHEQNSNTIPGGQLCLGLTSIVADQEKSVSLLDSITNNKEEDSTQKKYIAPQASGGSLIHHGGNE